MLTKDEQQKLYELMAGWRMDYECRCFTRFKEMKDMIDLLTEKPKRGRKKNVD